MYVLIVTFLFSLLPSTIHADYLERMKKECLLKFHISINILIQWTYLGYMISPSVKPLCSSWLISYPVHCW